MANGKHGGWSPGPAAGPAAPDLAEGDGALRTPFPERIPAGRDSA
jgi:hypothetical protein